jgi:transcriptional regulator with XRE-family HTH domain
VPRPKTTETALGWIPTEQQAAVIDFLALGYSQNAAARQLGVLQQTISLWLNDASFAPQFRERVAERQKLFEENLERIESQQQVMATALVGHALNGEAARDKYGNRPLDLDVAIELLRPRWRYRAGERHKQFGAT